MELDFHKDPQILSTVLDVRVGEHMRCIYNPHESQMGRDL